MVRAAARELAAEGIRVNALSPGITETPLTQKPENRPIFEEAAGRVPLQRAGRPHDMAAAALFLSSPEAAFITGANLVVDGGESLL
jgi:NAD(P)-dependent dehydrogenase (short-subunit alcohol dehydrogenase family)